MSPGNYRLRNGAAYGRPGTYKAIGRDGRGHVLLAGAGWWHLNLLEPAP